MQRSRITTQAIDELGEFVVAVRSYMDAVHTAIVDGTITPDEQRAIISLRRLVEREGEDAVHITGKVDATIAYGLSGMHNGFDARTPHEHARVLRRDFGVVVPFEDRKKRHRDSHPDSAA